MFTRLRPGLTLIELLVALMVFALLLTLLAPGLYHAREAARRTQCRDHMKQLGIAMHNYHAMYRIFPPGITSSGAGVGGSNNYFIARGTSCDRPGEASVSGLTLILPYMQEQPTYDAYNFKLACCAMENATAVTTPVAALVCPSNPRTAYDATPNAYYLTPPGRRGWGAPTGPAPTDYVFSMGAVALPTTAIDHSPVVCGPPARVLRNHIPAFGAFNVNSSVGPRAIKDGLANTLLMAECVGGAQLKAGAARPGGPVAVGCSRLNGADPRLVCDQAWSQGYIGGPGGAGGYGSVFAVTAFDAAYYSNGLGTPNGQSGCGDPLANPPTFFPIPVNEGIAQRSGRVTTYDVEPMGPRQVPSRLGSVQGIRSYHGRVAHGLFADGSTRAVAEDIDPKILVAISTRRAGELEKNQKVTLSHRSKSANSGRGSL